MTDESDVPSLATATIRMIDDALDGIGVPRCPDLAAVAGPLAPLAYRLGALSAGSDHKDGPRDSGDDVMTDYLRSLQAIGEIEAYCGIDGTPDSLSERLERLGAFIVSASVRPDADDEGAPSSSWYDQDKRPRPGDSVQAFTSADHSYTGQVVRVDDGIGIRTLEGTYPWSNAVKRWRYVTAGLP